MSACITSSSSPSLLIVTAVARSRGVMLMRTGVTENRPATAGTERTAARAPARSARSILIGSPAHHHFEIFPVGYVDDAPGGDGSGAHLPVDLAEPLARAVDVQQV